MVQASSEGVIRNLSLRVGELTRVLAIFETRIGELEQENAVLRGESVAVQVEVEAPEPNGQPTPRPKPRQGAGTRRAR